MNFKAMIDIHCHLLWNVDDGSSCQMEAIEMLKIAISGGTKKIIATPHISSRYPNEKKNIELFYKKISEYIKKKDLNIEVFIGAEILFQEENNLFKKLNIMTLNNSEYLLLEFPWVNKEENYNPIDIVDALKKKGYKVIIAHPERYSFVQNNYGILYELQQKGCLFQINRTSILGMDNIYGAYELSLKMLQDNLVDIIASDGHKCYGNRIPYLKDIYEYIIMTCGSKRAKMLFEDTPNKILRSQGGRK